MTNNSKGQKITLCKVAKGLSFGVSQVGLSLVELLVVVAILGIVLGAVLVSYTSTLRVFTDVRSLSDPIETKIPSIELLARYFDRWGVGVIAKTHNRNCTICPEHQMSLNITQGNPCDTIEFFGNLYGAGFVREVNGTANDAAKVISCRLDMTHSSTTKANCYTLWRNNNPVNDYITVGNTTRPIMLGLRYLTPNNADCINIPSNVTHTATMDDEMSPYDGNIWKKVLPGDIIHRAAHRIKLYCSPNPNDGNRNWLYVDLTDHYGECNEHETASPVAPVNLFKAEALPSGCNPRNGTCQAVRITVEFRSQLADYSGNNKTFRVTRTFGR